VERGMERDGGGDNGGNEDIEILNMTVAFV
jgi:hypothetical protein